MYARAEYELGNYAAAEAALRKVLAVHSEDRLILNNLGVVLKTEAKYATATCGQNCPIGFLTRDGVLVGVAATV
ncbi:MAG: hypothetical protein WBL63_17965 [Candidatus Acidiferrum sp.]